MVKVAGGGGCGWGDGGGGCGWGDRCGWRWWMWLEVVDVAGVMEEAGGGEGGWRWWMWLG